ncbi:MAG TPA: hypothetical protein VGA80_11685 [Flavobacteriaceae bacterium]
MTRKITILLLLILSFKMVRSQVVIENNEQIEGFMKIPNESVFVHFNSSLLFTGEYLYYSVYCLNTKTKLLSDLSKVAYVELVGPNAGTVFTHKIKLEHGVGSGDFFIPVSVSSGNYKLVAYTNWMRNNDNHVIFQTDINIINPYKTSTSISSVNDDKSQTKDLKLDAQDDKNSGPLNSNVANNNSLNLKLDSKKFNKRSKVSLRLSGNTLDVIPKGNYSVSVRKKGSIPKPNIPSTLSFIDNLKNNKKESQIGTKVFLPELRGELFSGKVSTLNNNLSLNDLSVAISIPGDNSFFRIVKTNDNGEFFVEIDKYYSVDKMYLQVLGDNRNEYQIKLDEFKAVDHSNFEFNAFKIDPTWKDEIIKQSVHNQIESAYFEFKPDSILAQLPLKFFENKKAEVFNLDDYTRFNTIRETITEIVKNVSFRKVNNENYVLELQGFTFGTNTGIPPLVLVDGVVIQDHTALLEFNANNVTEISVYRDQFVIGFNVFQGAISIKSIKGIEDYLQSEASIYSTEFFKPQLKKNYFTQIYTLDNQNSRIPDDRIQLLWIPHLELNSLETKLDFYTSDVEGEFETSLVGFTLDGKPVSVKNNFKVE